MRSDIANNKDPHEWISALMKETSGAPLPFQHVEYSERVTVCTLALVLDFQSLGVNCL